MIESKESKMIPIITQYHVDITQILIICITFCFSFVESSLDDAIIFGKCKSSNLDWESKLTNLEL